MPVQASMHTKKKKKKRLLVLVKGNSECGYREPLYSCVGHTFSQYLG